MTLTATSATRDTGVMVTSPAPRAVWQQCCDEDPFALVTQSPRWADAMEATGRWRDVSRLYSFSDGRSFVLPLVRRRGPDAMLPRASMPDAWGYGGPVGRSLDSGVVEMIIEDLWSLGASWVRVRPNPLHADLWNAGLQSSRGGMTLAKRAHVLDLDSDPEALFSTRFTSSCRRAIRSAEKAGLRVESDSTGRLTPVFHELLQSSVDRWAGFQNEPLRLARLRASRRDPLSKFQAWSDALGDECRVLVAYRGDTPLASIVVLQGHNAHYTRGAMDRTAVGNDRPNELLMWHAMRGAITDGCRWFHLGESGDSSNLSRYKEKFGAVAVPYEEYRFERVPATALDRGLRSGVKRLIRFRDVEEA